ncbi:MAG: DNA repair protein RecO [Spirochaetales bacterium]|nr:DNA repair protein RecO [Spirochaetales bacterium]
MFRSSVTPAIVLRKTRMGEIHRSLTLLTPGQGLVQAVAHGAYKMNSRLRPCEPFSIIKAYLYHEPVKNQYKLTDAEVLELLEGVRASVLRYYAASLWAEVALKSFGAGESFGELYRLLHDALLLLDRLPEEREGLLMVQFVMRFLALSGQAPELAHCDSCHAAFAPSQSAFLDRESATLKCARCAPADGLLMPAGARAYLEGTLGLPLAQAARVGLEGEALARLRRIAFHLLEVSLESRLNTLRAGEGIL